MFVDHKVKSIAQKVKIRKIQSETNLYKIV